MQTDDITKKEQEIEGVKQTKQDDIYTLLECHVNLDLEGFEDMGCRWRCQQELNFHML